MTSTMGEAIETDYNPRRAAVRRLCPNGQDVSATQVRRNGTLSDSGGFLGIHEVVADHVGDDHVRVFDAAHVRVGNLNIEFREGTEAASISARQRYSVAAGRSGVFDRTEHVRRVARSADRHHDISGLREILQLLNEYTIVADVVRICRESGQRIGERHDAEPRRAVETGALDHVADEMRGGGSAAAVSANKYVAAFVAGFGEDLDRPAHLRQVEALNGAQKIGFVLFWKCRGHPAAYRNIAGQKPRLLVDARVCNAHLLEMPAV